MTTKGTFDALNPDASIFIELVKQQPTWWPLFTKDSELNRLQQIL